MSLLFPLHYIVRQNRALKAFTDLTLYDLTIFYFLCQNKFPCTYTGLLNNLWSSGYKISTRTYVRVLTNGVDNGYIHREKTGKTVYLSLTLEGRKLLYDFCAVLDREVAKTIEQYGNGIETDT